jgi:hypothetical protein
VRPTLAAKPCTSDSTPVGHGICVCFRSLIEEWVDDTVAISIGGNCIRFFSRGLLRFKKAHQGDGEGTCLFVPSNN